MEYVQAASVATGQLFRRVFRRQEAAIGHPFYESVWPVSHGGELGACAESKGMASHEKNVGLHRRSGLTILLVKAIDAARSAAVVCRYTQKGRRVVPRNSSVLWGTISVPGTPTVLSESHSMGRFQPERRQQQRIKPTFSDASALPAHVVLDARHLPWWRIA